MCIRDRSETNLKLGNFFCECLKKLGFRAYKTKNTRWFYRWVSQVSPFLNWVYKIVLGLDEKETTTYNPIKVDWLPKASKEIVRRFLQGIYESDGCISLYGREISCVTFPNATLIQKLLNSFDINSKIGKDKYKKISIYGFNKMEKSHNLLFAPEIGTERYQLLEMLVNSKSLEFGQRLPSNIKMEIIKLRKEGFNYSDILKTLLQKHNLRTSTETVKRALNS